MNATSGHNPHFHISSLYSYSHLHHSFSSHSRFSPPAAAPGPHSSPSPSGSARRPNNLQQQPEHYSAACRPATGSHASSLLTVPEAEEKTETADPKKETEIDLKRKK
jgi:hypothetical protein